MKTEFKTEDDLLKICIEPNSIAEKELLREYMQKEIPGLDHSHQFEYDKHNNTLKTFFTPIINKKNLLKEGFLLESDVPEFDLSSFLPEDYQGKLKSYLYIKQFGNISLVVNTFGGYFHYDNKGNFVTGQFRNIYQVRKYIEKNREIWLTMPGYQL